MADNKEMKTLGGYEIVDEKAREEIHVVSEKADEALSLAKGATKAFVYDTYSDMIAELNALDKAELLVNFHVMIRTVCVPDLWISGVSDEHVEYTYTSNEDFIADLTEDGVVQVGYFVLSALETQKVELDDYVKKDDFATRDKLGLVYANPTRGISVTTDGGLIIEAASSTDVDNRAYYIPITGRILDYAVMKALTDPKNHEWTDEQKQLARALLGSVGFNDKATSSDLGLVMAHSNYGVMVNNNGLLVIAQANNTEIDGRTNGFKPLAPKNLDYAVKKALSDCKLSGDDVWTEEEKAKALELLGVNTARMEISDQIATLEPNKLYVFPEMASLEISLGGTLDNSIMQEYTFRFTSGATATTLVLPSTVIGDITIEANTVYEVSIVDNYLMYQSWAVE